MGIGGAMMMPATLAIITDMFRDPAERQRAIGIWAGTTGLGIALGPIVGGLLLASFWWGSVFLINVPIAIIGAACALPLIPDSKNPAARPPDLVGALMSIAGLGLVLWSLIEAPTRGWSSPRVIGAGARRPGGPRRLRRLGAGQLAPDAEREFLPAPQVLTAAVSSVGLVMFGLFGALFVLTQYLQFSLGYSALQAGVRVLPAAGAIAVIAPLSTVLVRAIGTKLTVAGGLLVIAAGLWQVSLASAATTYTGMLPGMILLGIGAGLAIPSATESVMGSLPGGHTGVGSATNGAFLQIGGALGVAVIGSLLNTRYQDRITGTLAPYHVPHAVMQTILGSLGGALGVAARVGGPLGAELAHLARSAFISGMDLGLATGACVALAGCLIALIALPSRAPDDEHDANLTNAFRRRRW